MAKFRFSSNIFGLKSRDEFAAMCRRAEDHGYDTIFAADHLGLAAPFQAAVAAAGATERLRVGILVVNVPFWNPALLAREIATADILTGGRLEVGLGAGHMKWEFDAAGLPWEPHGARADKLATAISERFVRDCAGDRADALEWHALVQVVRVTDDRRAAAAELAEQYRGTVTAEEILVNPFLFIGTIEEMAGQVIRNRARYGFTYYTVHEPFLDAFAPVIYRVRALLA